jgi:glycosyltransferase involved in cell wall biosynthesis
MQVELVAHNPIESVSGIGRYTRELYRHLSARVDVRVVRPVSPPLAKRLTFLHQLPLGLRDHQPGSIVHFTQIMGCSQMLWHPVRPSVASVHDLGVLVCPEDEQLYTRFGRWVLDVQLAGLRRVDHFIVHSDHTRDGLIKHLGIRGQQITIVPTWIDSDFFRPVTGSRQILAGRCGIDLDDGIFNLAYIGSELPRKNLALLLEAMAILKARGHRTRLVKIGGAGGDQWRARTLQDVERLGLSEDVVFTGVISDDDVVLFLNAADLCVTPTLLESTFAWVALGAMACGRPSVVTSSALVPEEAQDAVLVVPSRNLDRLVQAIEQCILDADLRQRMGEAGRRIIRSYRGETTAGAIISALRALLERG